MHITPGERGGREGGKVSVASLFILLQQTIVSITKTTHHTHKRTYTKKKMLNRMRLLVALFACVLIGANASVKCDVCKRVAGYAYQKIEHRGCGIVTKLEGGSMCEIVGFGPEDPMADVCVAVVWKGCDYLMKEIEKGFFLPQHLCQHWCGADSSSSGWRRLKWWKKFKKKAKRVWKKGKNVWKKGKKVYEKVKPVVQWINAVRDAKKSENRYGNARRLMQYPNARSCVSQCGQFPDCGPMQFGCYAREKRYVKCRKRCVANGGFRARRLGDGDDFLSDSYEDELFA